MRLIAKDFSNKPGLLDAVLEISGKFIETPRISIVGIPDVNIPLNIKQMKFRLLPKDTTLEVPEMPAAQIIQAFFWTHTEARISNDDTDAGNDWMSENTLMTVINAWSEIDRLLAENRSNLDDYLTKITSDRISKYTFSRDDLMLLLSLRGGSTLRQVILSHRQTPLELVEMLVKAMSHGFLCSAQYDSNLNYPISIKAMGERINLFIKQFCEAYPSERQQLANQITHDLKLLSEIYSESDCIGFENGFIDVDEAASSLALTKEIQHSCRIGAGILKPLNTIFASLITSCVWKTSIQDVTSIIKKVDLNILEKYSSYHNNRKPSFIGVSNE